MSNNKSAQIKLGIFLFVSFTLLILAIIALAGLKIWESRDYYKIVFRNSVGGVDIGSPVKLNGVQIGRVDSIKLNTKNIDEVIINISVDSGIPLKNESEAVVMLQGITGLRYIEISKATIGTRTLESGDTIKEGTSELDELSLAASDIASQTKILLGRFLKMTETKNMQHIDNIIASIDSVLTNMDRLVINVINLVQENRMPLNKTINNISNASLEASNTVIELRTTLNKLATSIDQTLVVTRGMAGNISNLAKTGQSSLKNIDQTVNVVKGQLDEEQLSKLMNSLVITMGHLAQTTGELERTLVTSQGAIQDTLKRIKNSSQMLEDFTRNLRDNPSILLDSDGLPERQVE